MQDDEPDEIETTLIEGEPEPEAEEIPQEEEPGELIVTLGEEEEEPESPVITTLRKKYRETQRELRDLKSAQASAAPVAVEQLGTRPDLKDFDYDTVKYDAALLAWSDKKRKADERAAESIAETARQDQDWNGKLTAYRENAAKLGARDYEEAEESVKSVFSGAQQGIIVHAAENAPLMVYALGKNPKKAVDLAKITDPVLFAVAMTRLEMSMKVSGMKSTPAPERRVKGAVASSGGANKLEKLRAEAERTGDITPVLRYKRELAAANK